MRHARRTGPLVRLRARLLERMSARERVELEALRDDALERGKGRRVALEELRADGVRRDADVGERRPIAMAEPAGLRLAGKMRLDRPRALVEPVPDPLQPLRLVDLELVAEVVADPRHDQRVDVARRDLRQPPDARAGARLAREERRLGMGLVQVLEDRERLEERWGVAVEERRHHALRVDAAVPGRELLALQEIDDRLLEGDRLEVERDPHAERGERAPEAVEFHAVSLTSASPGRSAPARRLADRARRVASPFPRRPTAAGRAD